MKLLYQTLRKRLLNEKHALDQAERGIRFKERKRRLRRLGIDLSAKRDTLGVYYRDYKRVVAPQQFSFLKNPEGVISFIKQLEEHFTQKSKVWIVLKKVENIDDAAIVVLLAIMVRFKSHDIKFNGDFPKNKDAKNLLMKSGFFSNLMKTFGVEDRYHIAEDAYHRIHTHAWKNVDPALSATLISSASQQIWGSKQRCLGVQRVLLELMQNTNNHAEIGKSGEKHWWLSIHHPKDQKKVCFSFVDFGVGVFTSLDNKPEHSKFHNWAAKMRLWCQYGDNADLLRLILEGKLHSTVTGKPYRGKGLPGIADASRRNQIDNLNIITNDVFCLYGQKEFRKLSNSFNGTLVCWEISENNEHLPDN